MPKKNGFFYLMQEMQNQFAKKGQKKSMSDLQSIASQRWQQMSKEEKAIYDELAKQANRKVTTGHKERLTSDGVPLSVIQKKQSQNELKLNQDILKIQVKVNSEYLANKLHQQPIYIISFNYLCQFELNNPIPREIGIVKYSIERGLLEVYHKFINTQGIPTGFASKAKESVAFHSIPYYDFDLDCSNHAEICGDIQRMIDSPMVFCHKDFLESNSKCLDWLLKISDMSTPFNFMLYDAAVLIMEISYIMKQPFHSISSVEDNLNRALFDYVQSVSCPFHEEIDNRNCALAMSKKISFGMTEICCPLFKIQPTINHLPKHVLEPTANVPKGSSLALEFKQLTLSKPVEPPKPEPGSQAAPSVARFLQNKRLPGFGRGRSNRED